MVYTHKHMVKLVNHILTKPTVVNGWIKYEIFWSSPLIWECLKISSGLIWPTLRRHINSWVNLSWISNRSYVFYLLHSCIITFPKLDIYFQSWWKFILFISAIMSSSNPIIALLANEKLNGDNYIKWKSNINIVLICENQKFVLTEDSPPEPHATASRNVRENIWFLAAGK